jgi:hypothetical protein
VTNLLATLAAELERPRAVSPQVIKHIVGTHGVAREDIGAFLTGELPKLEDYEIDLILAPLFTPSLADQSVFAELLGKTSIATDQWSALIQQLTERSTLAHLITEDGATHPVPLRDVTIERFTHRLRLEGMIDDGVFQLISNLPQAGDRALLKAIARRATWENASRREILTSYLKSVGDTFRADDAVALLKLAETYEPASVAELRARIPHWRQVLRQEINEGGTKPFFNERVEELHGGGRDQRRPDNSRTTAKEIEQAFLERLQGVLT